MLGPCVRPAAQPLAAAECDCGACDLLWLRCGDEAGAK